MWCLSEDDKYMNFGVQLCVLVQFCMPLGIYCNEDVSEIDNKLVKSYATRCVKERSLTESLSRLHDTGIGEMGYIHMHGVTMEARSFNKNFLALETMIFGTASEFEQPEQYLLDPEVTSVKGRLLLDMAKQRSQAPITASSIVLSKYTKCELPRYYSGQEGTIKCVTFVPKTTMVAALKEASQQLQKAKDEDASGHTSSN